MKLEYISQEESVFAQLPLIKWYLYLIGLSKDIPLFLF